MSRNISLSLEAVDRHAGFSACKTSLELCTDEHNACRHTDERQPRVLLHEWRAQHNAWTASFRMNLATGGSEQTFAETTKREDQEAQVSVKSS